MNALFSMLLAFMLFFPAQMGTHPVHISIINIEHNSKENMLEISCRVLTNDFENGLRATSKIKVDLLDSSLRPGMDSLVAGYLKKHLIISIDGKKTYPSYLGYEQDQDGLIIYLEVDNVSSLKKMEVTDDILYEYKEEQVSLIHVMVGGIRKSTKLNNPNGKASFLF